MTNIRYKYSPQMEFYDKMPESTQVPYALYTGCINYDDGVCIKVDSNGFRYSNYEDKNISSLDIGEFEKVNIIVGGSTVFGVGSSSNKTTISSLLSLETKIPWINIGLRGGNSFQEYIHLIQYISKATNIENIVFLSGINDIYLNLISKDINGFDPMYDFESFERRYYGCKRRFSAWLLSKFKNVDMNSLLDAKGFKAMLFKKINKQSNKRTEDMVFEQLYAIFKRNFILYNGLQKSLSANVLFILQPFFYWTQKKASFEEKEIFEYLETMSENSTWEVHKKKMTMSFYNRNIEMLAALAKNNDISFIDSNNFFSVDNHLFVDSVHLNDSGNKVVSKIILDNI